MSVRGWNDHWQASFDALSALKRDWPTRGWTWDSRVGCVTSSFTVEQELRARAAVNAAMPAQYTHVSLERAPAALQQVVEISGGLRPGQLALALGPTAGLLVFGLWWPWGDGETISFRLGLADVDPAKEPNLRFRELFHTSY
ncbi:MAG: hypothetical protein IPF92_01850 [Myxococcales bacterium]|nr:hypothetical protein [Myxococcales bacterium]MBL0193874.1 hypothetical protein [Myxococcales bacterium]HQY62559.1 hypothetical protein [Polyangiaceae bacterium]